MTAAEAFEKIAKAKQEVVALCNGKQWRMYIPVQNDNSDCIIMGALQAAEEALHQAIAQTREAVWQEAATMTHQVSVDINSGMVEQLAEAFQKRAVALRVQEKT